MDRSVELAALLLCLTGLAIELVGALGMTIYRIRRRLPGTPLHYIAIGGCVFVVGVAVLFAAHAFP